MRTVFSASKFYPVTGSRTWFLSSDVCLMQKFWWSLDVFEENMIRFNLFPMEKTSSTNSELPESRKRILESKINGNGHVWSMDPFFSCAGLSVHDGNAMLKSEDVVSRDMHPRCSRGRPAFCKAKSLAPSSVRGCLPRTFQTTLTAICFRVHAGKDLTIMGGFD